MTGTKPAGTCQVSLLIPHHSRIALVVADVDTLPTVRMESAEPDLPEILAAVDAIDTATTTPARLVVTRSR